MKNLTFLALAFCLIFASCASEGGDASAKEKSVDEVANASKVTKNSDVVRNPVTADVPDDTINVAKLQFEEETYNYGKVKEGAPVEHIFKFKNVGKVPLIISQAKSTCGCTVPTFPKDPIPPGEGGEIAVKFNTKAKKGRQKKPVNITANTYPKLTTVYIDGEVEEDPVAAAERKKQQEERKKKQEAQKKAEAAKK